MGASNRLSRAVCARLRGAAGVAACLLALAACKDNRAGGGNQASNATSDQQPSTASAPQVSANGGQVSGTDTTQRAPAPATPGADSAASMTKPGTDSSRSRAVARAPRANPAAPSAGAGQTAPPPSAAAQAPDNSTTTSNAPLRDPYHQPPKDTVSQVVYTGWKQYNLNCARCHGEDVTGTTIAPHLIESFRSGKVDHTEFWNVVHGSRMQKGMPNWSGIIPDDQLEAIYQYIKARSDGKVGPGRPAVKAG